MKLLTIIILAITLNIHHLQAWHDQTHMAIAKAAGMKKAYMAVGADMAKIKAGDKENFNHWHSNEPDEIVTREKVIAQIPKYNSTEPEEKKGHLYGAIIASINEFRTTLEIGKFAEYHIGYLAHYVGDLSMPLHNTNYNDFNKARHLINDGIIEDEVANNIHKIIITEIEINSLDDIIDHIVKIANESKELGYKMERENRNMTKEEAYIQISKSASLLRAILKYLNYPVELNQ